MAIQLSETPGRKTAPGNSINGQPLIFDVPADNVVTNGPKLQPPKVQSSKFFVDRQVVNLINIISKAQTQNVTNIDVLVAVQNFQKIIIDNAEACRYIYHQNGVAEFMLYQGGHILPGTLVTHSRSSTPFTLNPGIQQHYFLSGYTPSRFSRLHLPEMLTAAEKESELSF